MAVAFERSQNVGRVLDREDGARTQLLFHALIKFRKNPRRRVIALVQFCRTKKFLPSNKAEKKKEKKKKIFSPAGNRTPVSRVTGGDTHHYTTEDAHILIVSSIHRHFLQQH